MTKITSTKKQIVRAVNPDFKELERKIFPFGFKIISPQFSVFKEDVGSQILFTSRDGFMIYLRHHFMKYDLFNQDPKNIICFNCEDMTIYSAPPRIDFDRKVFWMENKNDNQSLIKPESYPESSAQAAEFLRRIREAEQKSVTFTYIGRSSHQAAVYRKQTKGSF